MAAPAVPTTQRAVIIKQGGPNYTLEVDNAFPVPKLEPDHALVRLSHSGVCHSDLSLVTGIWAFKATCKVPGHEGIGRIVAYHPSQSLDVSALPKVGSKVGIPLVRQPCGKCAACTLSPEGEGEVYCTRTAFHGTQVDGTYQQYMVIPSAYMVPVPEAVDDAQAAPILCGGVTVYKALKKCGTRKGDWVVIAGCGGGLGNFAVQYAVAMGFKVIGIDAGEDKKAKTLSFGVEAFVDFKETPDVPKRILELTGGDGAHAAMVIAPAETTYNQAMMYVRLHGIVMCVGLPNQEVNMQVNPSLCVFRDVQVKGSLVGTKKDIIEALDFLAQGQVKPDVAVHKLEDVMDVYHMMEENKIVGRAALDLQ